MASVAIDEICRILAGDGNPPLSKPRITQLVKEGMPVIGRNEYDPVRCMYWYIGTLRRHVRARMSENQDGTSSSVEQERKRLLRAQAEREEMALAKDRGEMITINDHERIVSDLIQETRARVRSVAPRVAQDLVGETSRTMIQAKLEKAHDEALVALSKVVPRIEVPPPEEPVPKPEPVKADQKPKAPRQAKKKTPTKKVAAKKASSGA